ncbi:MAG: TrkA family potassium uptake protein [Solobacterium sp.]|nr:TrkA family potassium uptake protein [Solobacterium sp.]
MTQNGRKLFVVIGMGNFGSSIAKTMANAGGDVIAIDRNMLLIQELAETVPNAICLDSRDIEMLRKAGVQDADTVIVAMGSHLEDAVETILNLQELDIKNIICKANSTRYGYVMERIGATQVIEPENEMGQRVAISLMNPKIQDIYQMNDDFAVMEIKAPELWINRKMSELNLRELYGVNVIGIRTVGAKRVDINVTPDTMIKDDDVLVIAADANRIAALNLD